MNVFLAYLLDEYEKASKNSCHYEGKMFSRIASGDYDEAERMEDLKRSYQTRRIAFVDVIHNFIDLTGELDPDDVAAAEKALVDF